jgi:hypothetical protein
MRKRTFHTSVNLLIQPMSYSRLKRAAAFKKTSMSKIIREGINLILDKVDKERDVF